MLQGEGHIGRLARDLRGEMSLPEVLLWRALCARPDGLKFRRQHPSGPYIADFYCHEARLIVEVDGEAHSRGDRPARDLERDRWFVQRGLRVLRVPATLVLNDLDAALRGILAKANPLLQGVAAARRADGWVSRFPDSGTPRHHGSHDPSLLAGEDRR